MPIHPRTCPLLYSTSCLLDALDGAAARRLGQSTQFGAVIDMVTDRCTTTCLLVFLASAFPRWSIVFQGLISLDYSNHYIHLYATLVMSGDGQSHKEIDEGRPWALRVYYSNIVCDSTHWVRQGRANDPAVCPLLGLYSERTVLHCVVFTLLLVPCAHAIATGDLAGD